MGSEEGLRGGDVHGIGAGLGVLFTQQAATFPEGCGGIDRDYRRVNFLFVHPVSPRAS